MLDASSYAPIATAPGGVRALFHTIAAEGRISRCDWASRVAPAILGERAAIEARHASPEKRSRALEALADACIAGLVTLARADLTPRWPGMAAPVAILSAGRFDAPAGRSHLILGRDDENAEAVANALALYLSAGLLRLDFASDVRALRLGRHADLAAPPTAPRFPGDWSGAAPASPPPPA